MMRRDIDILYLDMTQGCRTTCSKFDGGEYLVWCRRINIITNGATLSACLDAKLKHEYGDTYELLGTCVIGRGEENQER